MKAGQAAVACVACGDSYRRHETGGGPCRVVDEDGRCPCKGFRWVPLVEGEGGERVGSYRAG